MSQRYFALREDVYVPGRWYPDEPTDSAGQEVDDVWQFTDGKRVHIEGRLRIPLYRLGTPLDFCTTAVGTTPIVHPKVAAVFAELAPDDVQFIPVEVQGQSEAYSVLVATRLIRCIDEKASREIAVWKAEDGRPDRTGEYRIVAGMRIDSSKVGDAKVFRPWGWTVALIVSADIKDALERVGAVGVKFTEV
jgi:hypothetical protein